MKNEGLKDLVKQLMNTWWGRSIQKNVSVTTKVILKKNLDSFIERQPLFYSHVEIDEKHVQVRTLRPILAPWNVPQFGVNVMSWSRRGIQEIVFRVIDAGAQVYYANTDCVLSPTRLRGLVREGTGFGEFKVEDEMTRFICLKPKTRLMVLKNGKLKNKYGKPSLDWFVEEAEKMRAKLARREK
jgi:hypothetical protein